MKAAIPAQQTASSSMTNIAFPTLRPPTPNVRAALMLDGLGAGEANGPASFPAGPGTRGEEHGHQD